MFLHLFNDRKFINIRTQHQFKIYFYIMYSVQIYKCFTLAIFRFNFDFKCHIFKCDIYFIYLQVFYNIFTGKNLGKVYDRESKFI